MFTIKRLEDSSMIVAFENDSTQRNVRFRPNAIAQQNIMAALEGVNMGDTAHIKMDNLTTHVSRINKRLKEHSIKLKSKWGCCVWLEEMVE